ncbi:MAG: TVP38/TMEM64 family protein [Desulfuromonadales bacterium]|nr:TVP38/TMEM64 family protein [Desulfuromonadales bacterium]
MQRIARRKMLGGVAILTLLAASYWLARESGALNVILDGTALREWIAGLGLWGPLAVVGLMTLAILVSPIPSAPIAVAAGAAYGHVWGTIYALIGAEAGALAAFGVARLVGHEVLYRWFGDRLSVGWLGSQNALMGLVFVSRLLPFLSFDLVSYAAGLTVLSFWRFAVATIAGIIPASFLLAHFGDEMATGEGERLMISIGALGGITLIPFLIKFMRDRLRGRSISEIPVESQADRPILTGKNDLPESEV